MNGFRVLVVDDEPLAQEMVADLVRQDPDVEEVFATGSPRQVPALIDVHHPEIVFLDIEMPGIDGLQVAGRLGPDGPVVVFITAFSHYAAKAFDVNAIDYVMKPFSDQRLRDALEKAKRRVRERQLGELAHQVASVSARLTNDRERPEEESQAARYPTRLTVKVGERTLVLGVDEIVWVEAEDYYVLVHSKRGRHLVRMPLTSLEERLDPRRFIRVHRGALVNLAEIREVDHRDGMSIMLSDGARVPVSRSRRKVVDQALSQGLG